MTDRFDILTGCIRLRLIDESVNVMIWRDLAFLVLTKVYSILSRILSAQSRNGVAKNRTFGFAPNL